jgi:hypothetical protein
MNAMGHHRRGQFVAAAFAALLMSAAPACSRGHREQVKAAPESRPAKVNLDQIFPPGRGRDLVLNNCTTCHTFVPIVVLQMSKEAWERNSRDHRERVKALSDADFQVLYQYLVANFNPNRPVPKLPQELLQTWTAY